MTTTTLPQNPFHGEVGTRIAQAVRRAIGQRRTVGHDRARTVGDVTLKLRLDTELNDEDFKEFLATLLEPRRGWAVEQWLMAVIDAGAR